MKIIPQSVKLLTPKEFVENQVINCEYAARTCYNSTSNQTKKFEDAIKFLRGLVDKHHESVLEHSLITFEIVTNIGVSREFMRHRHQSPSERSTRYCNFSNENKYENGIEFCLSSKDLNGVIDDLSNSDVLNGAFISSERRYNDLIDKGFKAQFARHVLPLATKTVIVSSANIREWRHILKMRSSKAAHPDIREISKMIYDCFCELGLKALFEDVYQE